MLYIIQMGESGPVKIGFSKDVRKRLSALQIGSADRLIPRFVAASSPEIEKRIHERLSHYRMQGEWFRCPAEEAIAAARELGLNQLETDLGEFVSLNRKRGPKPLERDLRRTYILQIRMNDAERESIEEAADGDVSTWAREVILRESSR